MHLQCSDFIQKCTLEVEDRGQIVARGHQISISINSEPANGSGPRQKTLKAEDGEGSQKKKEDSSKG